MKRHGFKRWVGVAAAAGLLSACSAVPLYGNPVSSDVSQAPSVLFEVDWWTPLVEPVSIDEAFLDLSGYSAEEVGLTLRLGVKNPNPFPLRLEQLTYTLEVAGKVLDEGTLGKADTVDASATGTYPLEATVNASTWGKDVKALIAKGTLPYTLKGEVKGPLLRQPFTLEGSVKLNVSR